MACGGEGSIEQQLRNMAEQREKQEMQAEIWQLKEVMKDAQAKLSKLHSIQGGDAAGFRVSR